MIQPQEVEVWYVLPAIRRELTLTLVNDFNLKQKQVAELLGVQESTVSQYMSSKRAKEAEFKKEIKKEIKKSAKKIIQNKYLLTEEIQRLCEFIRKKGFLCEISRKCCNEKKPFKCEVCMK